MTQLFPILIVEDNPDDFYLLKRAFLKNKIKNPIQWVQDGLEAIEYLQGRGRFADRDENPFPRVIVIDLKMPRLGGLELLEWIKSHSELSVLPVLVMSSSNLDVDIARAYDLGANSFFVKPTTFDHLSKLARTIHEYWVECVEPAPTSNTRSRRPAVQKADSPASLPA